MPEHERGGYTDEELSQMICSDMTVYGLISRFKCSEAFARKLISLGVTTPYYSVHFDE